MQGEDEIGNGRPVGTVRAWLRLYVTNPEEAGEILLATLRRAATRVRLPATDRDEVVAEAAARTLAEDHAPLRRANPSTPLMAWARGCVRIICLEAFRAREKEKAKSRPEMLLDHEHTPYEAAAVMDQWRYESGKVMEAALVLPKPYGHVLVWRLIEGGSWQEVRDRLNAHRTAWERPIGDRQSQKYVTTATRMLSDWLAREDLRILHAQKYLAKKNSWIGSTLPHLKSQIR